MVIGNNKRTPFLFIFIFIIFFGCGQKKELNWVEEEGFKWAELNQNFKLFDDSGFELIDEGAGIDFNNILTADQVSFNRVLINGSGVAVGDVDADGLTDIYFSSLSGSNKLYKNLGNWKFSDITEQSKIAMVDYTSTGVAFADLDSDSDLDLVVTTLGDGNKLFFNKGNGVFEESTNALETERKYGSHSIAIADIDRDGDLDIYITNYKVRSAKDLFPEERNFEDIVKKDGDDYSIYPKFQEHYRLEERGEFILWFEMGEPDLLFLNNGDGTFENVSNSTELFEDTEGIPISLNEFKDWGLHAKFYDFNNDLYPDLYVCNDFESPDRIWINNGNGAFREIDKTGIRNTSLSSMSVDFSDLNKDGNPDVFVAEMLAHDMQKRVRDLGTMIPLPEPVGHIENRPQYVGNALLLNRGDLTFANITDYAGVRASDWTWGTKLMDVDLDGYDDIILTNGNYYDSQDLDANNRLQNLIRNKEVNPEEVMLEYQKLQQSNFIFRNNRDLTFENKSKDWGFTNKNISHGIAVADLDNDGDQDLVINKLNSQAGIYRNNETADRITIKVIGDSLNTNAIGSKLKLQTEEDGVQNREVVAGGSYLSGSEQAYTFAALSDTLDLEITWYDGKISNIEGLKKNRIYIFNKLALEAGKDKSVEAIKKKSHQEKVNSLFADYSHLLNHYHHESFYNDFEQKQHLLPYRLSQPGPGLSWFDINEDGYDDLVIGAGKGGQMSIYLNKKGKEFENISKDDLSIYRAENNDISGILVLPDSAGDNIIAAAKFNYESKQDYSTLDLIDINKTAAVSGSHSLQLSDPSAISSLASADYDKDGDLDLFIGGRVEAGKFPAAASSWLLKNERGSYIIDKNNLPDKPGMVTGAVFSDINGDSWPDLLIARDWNSILLFINEQGTFIDKTEEWGLANFKGLWRGISTGDFNNDGKLDIVAGNIGENNLYKNLTERSARDIKLFYYPRRNIGSSIIESYFSTELGGWTPLRRLPDLGKEFSILAKNIKSHKQYSNSTIEELFGISLDNFNSVSANTFTSMVFINEGENKRFKAQTLPLEAQLTAAQGISISDFDADGNHDIFLSQNFFAHPVERPRDDAGRGLLLMGKGDGTFKPLTGQESGIKVNGEQRAVAVSDFNNDARSDIAVTQNGSKTVLYRNRAEKQGIAINLNYSSGNPDGIGAKLQFVYDDGQIGAIQEIIMGDGYLSQSSSTQIMGYKKYPQALVIIWPDGSKDTIKLPSNLLTINVSSEGGIINSEMKVR